MRLPQRLLMFVADNGVKDVRSAHEKLFAQHGFKYKGTGIGHIAGKKLNSLKHVFIPITDKPDLDKLGAALKAKGYHTKPSYGTNTWKKGGHRIYYKYGELVHHHHVSNAKLYGEEAARSYRHAGL